MTGVILILMAVAKYELTCQVYKLKMSFFKLYEFKGKNYEIIITECVIKFFINKEEKEE